MSDPKAKAYCIYVHTICDGPVPVERDGEGRVVTYDSEDEARREIAQDAIDRMQQFLDGERDFEDALTIEEFVWPVHELADGIILDGLGGVYGWETNSE